MLIIYHSLQMSPLSHHPFISNCKVPIYIRALKRTHEDQLNGDIVPCQVFLPRNLFAGVVAKHLQERQLTQMKQRHQGKENHQKSLT